MHVYELPKVSKPRPVFNQGHTKQFDFFLNFISALVLSLREKSESIASLQYGTYAADNTWCPNYKSQPLQALDPLVPSSGYPF